MQRYVLVGVMGCIVATFICVWSTGLGKSYSLRELPRDSQRETAGTAAAQSAVEEASAVSETHENNTPALHVVETMPAAYLIDRSGVIRHVHPGFRPGEAPGLRARVRELVGEPVGENR